MVVLTTLVLDPWAQAFAPLGKWLSRPDWPFDRTLTHEGEVARIDGASLTNLEDLLPWDRELVEVVVTGREKAPICGTRRARLWALDREGWVPLPAVTVGDRVRIPDRGARGGGLVVWGRVRAVKRHPLPGPIWPGTPPMCGTLKLARGAWSFASPGGFVHV